MEKTYQIKPGDSLGHVATTQGISLHDLLAANPQIANPDRVQVGQIINLPAPAASPAPAGASSAPHPASGTTTTQGASSINLAALAGHILPEALAQIPAIIERFKIDTPLKMAHFLAQCAHESNNFRDRTESLNYSADALKDNFHAYFNTDALCASYARNQEAIAARAYASRLGNGDEASKDGWKFRGRGFLQLTGKSNYAAFAKFVNDDIMAMPNLVADKYPMLSAAWFFYSNNLCELAAQGATDEVVTRVTKRVNGGLKGLDGRLKYFKAYYALLHG